MLISKGLPITDRLLSANGRNVSDEEKIDMQNHH